MTSPTKTTIDRGNIATDDGVNLFLEFAFFVREKFMTEVKMAKYPSTQQFDSKIHLLDQLREVRKDDGKLKGKEREEELKQVVAKLKEIKPETFDEAYNHPDMKHRMRWRLAIEKEK